MPSLKTEWERAGFRSFLVSNLLAVFFTGGIALAPSVAAAHPHVWVDMASVLVVDDQGRLLSVEETWTFDEFYTAFATEGLDTDGDGAFGEAELEALTQVNLESLAEWHFFSEATSDKGDMPFDDPVEARSTFVDGRLRLHFTLPLQEPAKAPVTVKVYDPTYYVSFEYPAKSAVTLAGSGAESCSLSVSVPDTEKTFANMPESFFNDPDTARMGELFATSARLTCFVSEEGSK